MERFRVDLDASRPSASCSNLDVSNVCVRKRFFDLAFVNLKDAIICHYQDRLTHSRLSLRDEKKSLVVGVGNYRAGFARNYFARKLRILVVFGRAS